MNDSELVSQLKSVRVPARTSEYWENFPPRVRSHLRPAFAGQPQRSFLPRLASVGGLVLACLAFVLVIWPAFHDFLKNEKTFQRKLTELPNHLRVFMADEHGLHHLIADQQ
jgi:hypothetical protein